MPDHSRLVALVGLTVMFSAAEICQGQMIQDARIEPFLSNYCFGCHSGDVPEGGLDVETFSGNVDDAEVRRRWVYLLDRVASSEMPPESAGIPDVESKTAFLQAAGEALTRADLANREVVLRRLNRNEYAKPAADDGCTFSSFSTPAKKVMPHILALARNRFSIKANGKTEPYWFSTRLT